MIAAMFLALLLWVAGADDQAAGEWLKDVQATQLGKGVAMKFKGGPEFYNGTLTEITPKMVRITTDQGIDLRLYVTREEIQIWGTYDPNQMRQAQAFRAFDHVLMGGGGGNVAH